MLLASGLFTSDGTWRYFPRLSITENTPSWANTTSISYVEVTASGMTPAIAATNARWRVEVLSEDEEVLFDAVCRLVGRSTLRVTWTNDGESQTDEIALNSSSRTDTGPDNDEPGYQLTVPGGSVLWRDVDSTDVFPLHSIRIWIEPLGG